MNCLNCGTDMTSNEVVTKKDRVSYDMCEKCGSLWLDAGEPDKMAFQVEGDIEYCEKEKDPIAEKQPKKCPRCDNSELEKVKFLESDDIFLHMCRSCGGFWLDGGELDLIDKELAKIMPVRGKGFSDFVNNVHVPYWFQRVKKKSSETDFDIDVPPIPNAKLEGTTTDKCPNCGNMLDLYKAFSILFEGCDSCKGVWLIKDELRELKNKVEGPSLRWLNDEIENIDQTSLIEGRRDCVKCKTVKMISVIFGKSAIVVDWCPKCHGIWLDRGAFEAIMEYLKDELSQMHHKEIEKQAAADLKRVWSGGPESRIEELRDARAAVTAMINADIFEHPRLRDFLMALPRSF
jgi:Zn-finger nucleic acid-binding protein